LLLYTDGIIEAENGRGDAFGCDALSVALGETAGLAPGDAMDRIIAQVQKWSASQLDDLTVLICDFTGEGLRASSAMAD
jgi:phosphoserine phosphatase RsbU/P